MYRQSLHRLRAPGKHNGPLRLISERGSTGRSARLRKACARGSIRRGWEMGMGVVQRYTINDLMPCPMSIYTVTHTPSNDKDEQLKWCNAALHFHLQNAYTWTLTYITRRPDRHSHMNYTYTGIISFYSSIIIK